MLQNFNKDGQPLTNICAWLIICVGLVSCIASFFITTPYGRYSRTTWGFGVNAQLAWLLQECPAFLVPFTMFLASDGMQQLKSMDLAPNVFLLLMFMIHYFRRSFIYPFWIRKTTPTPFLIFLAAFLFCMTNGYMQGEYLLHFAWYPNSWFHSLQFLFGSFLFFLGFIVNVHSDYVVTHLRKPGESGYKIPHGGLFEYISCPNFLGEIVEWGGFALASSSFVAFAFFFCTIFQIGTRACHHHRFYQEKFEDYPKDRKALIPFIL